MRQTRMTPEKVYVAYFGQAYVLKADGFKQLCEDVLREGTYDGLELYGRALSKERSCEIIGNDDAICLLNFNRDDARYYQYIYNF